MILAMVYLTGGSSSNYWGGIYVTIVASAFIFRWEDNKLGVWLILLVTLYLAVEVVMRKASLQDAFPQWNFSVFMIIFAMWGTSILWKLRVNEFLLRDDVESKQRILEQKNKELDELDKTKTTFFANISHELRTPLTLILGPLTTLRSFEPVTKNKKLSDLLDSMEENGLRLLRLINELLDLIRLDTDKYIETVEAVNLDNFLASTLQGMKPMAQEKEITLEIEPSESVEKGEILYADRGMLEKIATNLIGNAIKFTPPEGQVTVGVEKEEDAFLLQISDTGIGMGNREIEHMYDRFWQAEGSARRRYRGMGIGLALVNSLVQRMHGEIEVMSTVGKGTVFTVTIPNKNLEVREGEEEHLEEENQNEPQSLYTKAEQTGSVPPAPQLPYAIQSAKEAIKNIKGTKKPLLLYADDELALHKLMAYNLPDYKIISAEEGEEALTLAQQYEPDLILLDWMMPELDGLETCRKLREDISFEETPIIMITARVDEFSKISALEAGADDFLTKPYSPTEVRLKIKKLLGEKRAKKEIVNKSQELREALEDLQESESMLLEAEKLSSLGQMSAGIIHEINNPLTYVKTGLYSLNSYTKSLPEKEREGYQEIIEEIDDGVGRVISIVEDLRGFATQSTSSMGPQNVSKLVKITESLVGSRLSKVNYITKIQDHLYIEGNENQLCQVLVNLLNNSLDALEEVNKENKTGEIYLEAQEKKSEIILKVRDNGSGIPEEIKGNIFEPFFSTKDPGAGMGMGLSICYRILEKHNAKLEIDSEVGQYTEFRACFPC